MNPPNESTLPDLEPVEKLELIKAKRRGTPGAFRPHRLVIDKKSHARGPRPQAWWKKVARAMKWVAANPAPPVYTRPDPESQGPRHPHIYSRLTLARERAKTLNRS